MRIALVAESFAPRVNGVAGSVARVARFLRDRGDDPVIVCPDSFAGSDFEGVPVERIRSVTLPGVHDIDVAVTTPAAMADVLADLAPEVVHVASPLVLGGHAVAAAAATGIPSVAVFQTDIAAFARHYRLALAAELANRRIKAIHNTADLTLVPSLASRRYLRAIGVRRPIRHWGRGVDHAQFSPVRRSDAVRQSWGTEPGEVVVGFVGRLAPEKLVDRLGSLAGEPRVRTVIVGDGPDRARLETALPQAVFTGRLVGDDLGAAMASMDIVAATGESETFCQVVQEAMAAGAAVIAPAIGGPLDLVSDGRTGMLYHPGEDADFLACARRLVRDAELRARLADAASAAVAGRTWSSVCGELVDAYRLAIAGHALPVAA